VADRIRAVLDSNVVVDAFLGRRRASTEIMRALFGGRFEAFVTIDVLAEYHMALHSQSVRNAAQTARLHPNAILDYGQAINEAVQVTNPGPSFRTSDPDDDKFTAASSGAHADFVVSSDPALLDLGTVLEAAVVTPERFLELLK